MIDDLLDDLKIDEGWRSSVYDDKTGEPIEPGSVVQGWPTIGYGFLVSEKRGGQLPKHIGEAWLYVAATSRWNNLVRQEPWLLNLPEEWQRSLANMAYQMGVDGVLGFEGMLGALQRRDAGEAVRHGFDSRWARQTPNRAERVLARIR